MKIEIDKGSGFCFGVTTAIQKAEEELKKSEFLFCLGDIVHNENECERLRRMGMKTINHTTYNDLHSQKVLLRAHGEPPETYQIAEHNNLQIIDATCPVVLQLQKRVKKEYEEHPDDQIVIFGKPGHAEVLGLVGQTKGNAIILAKAEDVKNLDFTKNIRLFSQTTKPLSEFIEIVNYIESHIKSPASFIYSDTICRQVANRLPNIKDFATQHDAILFVSGLKSSNGRSLFAACKSVNNKSFLVDAPSHINYSWFKDVNSIGICGATSTPKWLMEKCKEELHKHFNE